MYRTIDLRPPFCELLTSPNQYLLPQPICIFHFTFLGIAFMQGEAAGNPSTYVLFCYFIRPSRAIGSLCSLCCASVYLLLYNQNVYPGLECVSRPLDAWSLHIYIVPIFVTFYIACLVQVQLTLIPGYILHHMIFYLGLDVASRKWYGVLEIRSCPCCRLGRGTLPIVNQ